MQTLDRKLTYLPPPLDHLQTKGPTQALERKEVSETAILRAENFLRRRVSLFSSGEGGSNTATSTFENLTNAKS